MPLDDELATLPVVDELVAELLAAEALELVSETAGAVFAAILVAVSAIGEPATL